MTEQALGDIVKRIEEWKAQDAIVA